MDDAVVTEFNFEVTGNGIGDLQRLATLLGVVNEAAGSLAQVVSGSNRAINAQARAVTKAAVAYERYVAAQSKAASGVIPGAAVTGTTATGAATSAGAGAGAMAAEIERISAERSIAIDTATAAKTEAIVAASEERKLAVLKAANTEAEAIKRNTSAKELATVRAEAQAELALRKADIDKRLAIEIAAQEKIIAVQKARATAEIAMVTNPGPVTAAKIAATEELAVTEAAAKEKLVIRQATEREITAIVASEAAKQRALALETAAVDPAKVVAGLSNARYALYSVGQTAGIAAAALGVLFTLPQVKSAQYTKAFNSVVRTTGVAENAIQGLRNEFIDLSTQIPEDFSNLTDIGTIAGQLDISSDSVANFTENVAKFSATTNVSVEEAATNIGRLAQLTGTSASEYNNLTAAIYQAGVTSVATEQEILNMGSEIATAGDLAGFSNVQIVALSAALASLGIQPEAARGSLQRIFNLIQVGADESSAKTQKLADIAGVSISELQQMWNDGEDGSQRFFLAFANGLDRAAESGVNTTQMLKDLGVNQVRDQRLLQVLANNTDVYVKAIDESARAYGDATAMSDAYDKQTDNLIDNFKRFTNVISAMMDAAGSSGELNAMVKALTAAAQAMLDFSKTPVGATMNKLITWVAGGVAALLAIGAAGAFAKAAMFGMITAANAAAGQFSLLDVLSGKLATQLIRTAVAFATGKLSAAEAVNVMNNLASATSRATAGMTVMEKASYRVNQGMRVASTATKGLSAAAIGLGKATIVLGVLTLAANALSYAWDKLTETAQSRADKSFGEGAEGLADALAKDKAALDAGEGAIRTYKKAVEPLAGETIPEWKKQLEDAANAQKNTGDKTDDATKGITNQTIAIGENTKAWLANTLATDTDFQKFWEDLSGMGADAGELDTFFQRLAQDEDQGVAFYKKKIAEVEAARKKIRETPTDGYDPTLDAQLTQLDTQLALYQRFADEAANAGVKLDEATAVQRIAAAAAKATGQAYDEEGNLIAGATEETTKFSNAISGLIDSVMAPYKLAEAWQALGESIAENGKGFEGFSDGARANVDAVIGILDQLRSAAGEDSQAFGESVLGMMVALQKQGINTGGSLSFLGEALQASIGGTYDLHFNSGPAQQSILSVIDSAIAAQRAIMVLQASAMATSVAAMDMAAYAVAASKFAAAQASVAQLNALRAAALSSAANAQKNYNYGVNQGTKALNKNTGASKRNAAQTKKTVRTYEDWASDIKGVIDRMDDLRFGVSDAWSDIESAQTDAMKSVLADLYDFGKAYDQLFVVRETRDSRLSIWYQVQDDAKSAAEAVKSAVQSILDSEADLADISSERAGLTYGLQVAIDYGDTLREQKIRARLAELDAEEKKATDALAKAQQDLADAQDSQNKSLVGDSKQAIKNRSTVRDLLDTYSDYISKMVESGASTEDVASAAEQARSDFMDQAEALGFSASELEAYSAVFDAYASSSSESSKEAEDAVRKLYGAWEDYITQLASSGASQAVINKAIADGKANVVAFAQQLGLTPAKVELFKKSFDGIEQIVAKIPKNVTTKFSADTDPAVAALQEFKAKLDAAKSSADKLNSSLGNLGGNTKVGISLPTDREASKAAAWAEFLAAQKAYIYFMNHGGDAPTSSNLAKAAKLKKAMNEAKSKYNSYATGGFASGRYTGAGPKYEEAGIVHKGEYVLPKQAVNQTTGQPYLMEAVANGRVGAPMPAGTLVVELSPKDRALLDGIDNSATLVVDGKVLAQVVNKANKTSAGRGNG